MRLKVADIVGLPSMPTTTMGIRKWLVANNIPVVQNMRRLEFQLCDLPTRLRKDYLLERCSDLSLDPGTYDDAAHADFLQAPLSRRKRAERKAEIARILLAKGEGLKWSDRLNLVHEQFGTKGNSKVRLMALLRAVQGVDPINFAPALLDNHQGRTKRADFSEDAWRFFMTTVRNAAPEFPLKQAWRDTRDVGRKMGWDVPSWPTVYRRWCNLSEVEKNAARLGRNEAIKRSTIPAHRDKTTIAPLEWVSLDGRTQDFWVDFGDGRAVRPVMLALVDVASNLVLNWQLAETENATGTVRLIKQTCERFGIFDRLYPDNGSAFAGHLVAGGNVHRFRNGGSNERGIQPPGICKTMGIDIHFALPKNPQAKIAERTFATLSRVIDDRPEFKGCHAGHNPGARPSASVVPINAERAQAIIAREIDRHNREPGRRSQGARGRSYEQAFQDESRARIVRKPTARQLYLSGLIYSPVAVNRDGQVCKNGWVYGDHSTQPALLAFHGKGRKILLGRDPDDFSAPALAFDESGNLICEGIEPIQRGAYDSADGIRTAARNRRQARKTVSAAEAANNYLEDEEFEAALALLEAPQSVLSNEPKKVVTGQFKSPLKASRDARKDKGAATVSPEYLQNMDTALASRRASCGKLA